MHPSRERKRRHLGLDSNQPDATAIGPTPSRLEFWEVDITQAEDIVKVVEQVVSWTKQTGALLWGYQSTVLVSGQQQRLGEAASFRGNLPLC
jgi:hypothetical protein